MVGVDSEKSLNKSNELLELAVLNMRLVEFDKAEYILSTLVKQSIDENDWNTYLKAIPSLLRIYAEQNRHEEIKKVKEELSDLVIRKGLVLNEACFYALGACEAYRHHINEALDYLHQGLIKSEESKNIESKARILNFMALIAMRLGKNNEALSYDQQLNKILETMPQDCDWVLDLNIASLMFKGLFARDQGQNEEAIQIYEQTKEILSQRPSLYWFINLLYGMGTAYMGSERRTEAIFCLQTAHSIIGSKNLKNLDSQILSKLKDLNVSEVGGADLLIDSQDGQSVTEKDLGKIDFKNQFLLFELLRFLAKDPGKTHSKEEIIAKVWGQEYDPQVHDNKLYVTIKRLRKLVEPDFDKPSYILRRKGGYCLSGNKNIVVRASTKGNHHDS